MTQKKRHCICAWLHDSKRLVMHGRVCCKKTTIVFPKIADLGDARNLTGCERPSQCPEAPVDAPAIPWTWRCSPPSPGRDRLALLVNVLNVTYGFCRGSHSPRRPNV